MNSGNPMGLGLVWNSSDKKNRTTSYSAYLHNKKLPNLVIRTDCSVQRIVLQNQTAVAVELRGGEKGSVRLMPCLHIELIKVGLVLATKEIILSCGAFNTPQLLMLSGIGPRVTLESAGIATKVDISGVGQNLGDHSRVHIVVTLRLGDSQETFVPQHFDTALIDWRQLSSIWTTDEYRGLAPEIQRFIAMPNNPTCEFYFVSRRFHR